MSDIYEKISAKIRELRGARPGLSQEKLANELGTTANTVSRWETGTYKPSLGDLERISRYFRVPLAAFFPELGPDTRLQALMSATGDLDEDDFWELVRYAEFRQARKHLKDQKRAKQ
jgi:transcriptional regulator with XRE-family HTH domain